MKIIYILIMINILYWGISEQYIYDGSFVVGLFKGLFVSVLCFCMGFLAGKFNTRNPK